MALSDDQRALLRLLLEQGQSYEDIGSLLGLSVPEVQSRASSALAEIGGGDPDARVELTDYLLGQAKPTARADVARKLGTDPDALALARKLEAQLTLLAPSADLPELPSGTGKAPRAPRKSAKAAETAAAKPKAADVPTVAATVSASAGTGAAATSKSDEIAASASDTSSATGTTASKPSTGVNPNQKRIMIALIIGAAVVVAIVLIASGVFSGGSDKPSSSDTATDTPDQTSTTASNSNLTKATLAATDGSDASGLAILGKIKRTPAFEVNVNGLDQLDKDEVYLVTLYGSDKAAWPLGLMQVDKEGLGRAQYPFDSSLLTGLANGTFTSIDISIAKLPELNAAIVEAKKGKTTPAYVGTSVLRGKIEEPSQG